MSDQGTPNSPNPPGSSSASGASTVERVAQKAHEVVDRAAGRLSEQEIRLREKAAEADAQARHALDDARRQADQREQEVTEYVRANPLKAVGIAFAAGYVLSAIFRR